MCGRSPKAAPEGITLFFSEKMGTFFSHHRQVLQCHPYFIYFLFITVAFIHFTRVSPRPLVTPLCTQNRFLVIIFNYFRHVAMLQKFAGPLVGPLFCGASVRPNMLNMPKSASGHTERFHTCTEGFSLSRALFRKNVWAHHPKRHLRVSPYFSEKMGTCARPPGTVETFHAITAPNVNTLTDLLQTEPAYIPVCYCSTYMLFGG